ncbi:TRAM domain-containing protein [Modicisalibacter tunisiensis]|uniref:TRAM domain-containing protein n=1 Tax=Modicisalibacter tunisiensis TaxID=390637 RepID=UPI001CCC311E|nr:TRAM domain-containing protein [Modicisalibacter tunisiensis]MBZ9537936.1 TRAM domain-containing protein [Modicisalibacter tunisiensis]
MSRLGERRTPRKAQRNRQDAVAPCGADEAGGVVEIERLSHDGRGVARDAAGKTLFVSDALPGERVMVAVHTTRKRYDEAHVRERLTTATTRVAPVCAVYGSCGGCDLQHLAVEAQREHKREVLADQLRRQGVDAPESIELLAAEPLGYRRRARLGVRRDNAGDVHLGFRARGSHHLIDVDDCPVLMPELASLIAPLRALLQTLAAPRHVGHLELVAGETEQVVVVRQLREQAEDARRWQDWGEANGVAVAWLVGREQPGWRWLGKPGTLRYTLKGGARDVTLDFAPGDFLQVNAGVNQQLVQRALAWLAPSGGERVHDLFAGIGNFTLSLATRVGEVMALEGSAAMVQRLQANALANGLGNVTARAHDLGVAPDWRDAPDIVVLDPPREGAEAACDALASAAVPRVLYVACDPATLARDAARLVHGGYRLRRAAVADMFSQTAHLESMLLFERAG